MILIGLDDTDVLDSRGTGHLAREIAGRLKADYDLLGVTRHQLLVDPRVPCTKNNSCSAILLDGGQAPDLDPLLQGHLAQGKVEAVGLHLLFQVLLHAP